MAVTRFSDPTLAELPFGVPVRDRLLDAARAGGYQVVGTSSETPSAADLAATVRATVRAATTDDVLIVHVLSHGRVHGRSVQVYGSDGRADSGTSLDAWVADATGDDEYEDPLRRPGGDGDSGPWVLSCWTSAVPVRRRGRTGSSTSPTTGGAPG
jgi:hypothetical protein